MGCKKLFLIYWFFYVCIYFFIHAFSFINSLIYLSLNKFRKFHFLLISNHIYLFVLNLFYTNLIIFIYPYISVFPRVCVCVCVCLWVGAFVSVSLHVCVVCGFYFDCICLVSFSKTITVMQRYYFPKRSCKREENLLEIHYLATQTFFSCNWKSEIGCLSSLL